MGWTLTAWRLSVFAARAGASLFVCLLQLHAAIPSSAAMVNNPVQGAVCPLTIPSKTAMERIAAATATTLYCMCVTALFLFPFRCLSVHPRQAHFQQNLIGWMSGGDYIPLDAIQHGSVHKAVNYHRMVIVNGAFYSFCHDACSFQ